MALSFAHGAVQWLAADAATTTYVVSGLSFQPKAIRFYWVGLQSASDAVSAAVNSRRGVGFASGTSSRRCVGSFSQDTAATSNCGTVARNDAVAVTTDGAGATDGLLDISAIASDGFTLIVDDQAPANITVFWEAWGGADITDVTVGDIAEPAATGDQDYSATGFTSGATNQVVMLAGVQSVAAVNTAEAGDSGMHAGFATGSGGAQVVLIGNSDDASTAMDTDGYARGDECLGMIVIAGGTAVNARAALTQFGTDNFRLNWAARATTNRRSIYMAIKGGGWRAGDYTIDGNTGSATATVSALPFAPVGISLLGRMATESASNSAGTEDRMGFGSGSSTSSRRSMGVLDENATASSACEIDATIQYDQVLCFPSTAGALQSAYDISAMNSDGFTIIVDTAGGVASEWQGYLAFGDEPPVQPDPPPDAWPWADDDAPAPLVLPDSYQQSDPAAPADSLPPDAAADDAEPPEDDWWLPLQATPVGADVAVPVEPLPADPWPWGDQPLEQLVLPADYQQGDAEPLALGSAAPYDDDTDADDWWHALDALTPADAAAAPQGLPPADAWSFDDAGDDEWAAGTNALDAGELAVAGLSIDGGALDGADADDWWHAPEPVVPADVAAAALQPPEDAWPADEQHDAGDWWHVLESRVVAADVAAAPTQPPEDAWPWADDDAPPPLVLSATYVQSDAAWQPPEDAWPADEQLDADDWWHALESRVVPANVAAAPTMPPADAWPFDDSLTDDDELVIDDWQNIELDPIYGELLADELEPDDWWHALPAGVVVADVAAAPPMPHQELWREDEPDDDWWPGLEAVQRGDVQPAPTQPPEDAWPIDEQLDADDAWHQLPSAPVVADVAPAPTMPRADAWPFDDSLADDDELVIDDWQNIELDPIYSEAWIDDEPADDWWHSLASVPPADVAPTPPMPAADAWPIDEQLDDDTWWHGRDAATPADAAPVATQPPPEEWRDDEPDDDWWPGLEAVQRGDVAPVPSQPPDDAWPIDEQLDADDWWWRSGDAALVGEDVFELGDFYRYDVPARSWRFDVVRRVLRYDVPPEGLRIDLPRIDGDIEL